MFTGHPGCSKVGGFHFYKMSHYGISTQSASSHMIYDDVIIEDSVVGIFGISFGPDAAQHEGSKKTITLKNAYISGKGNNYDCSYDEKWQKGHFGHEFLERQRPSFDDSSHTAIVMSDFLSEKNEFPAAAWSKQKQNMAMYGKTCVLKTQFANFNRKCGSKDLLVRVNKKSFDHVFPMNFIEGNTLANVNEKDMIKFARPDLGMVNIADCVDLFCDGLKKAMIIDESGEIFGAVGTLLAESEYEWDGITRMQPDGRTVRYKDTRDGLGNYRIPKPMQTRMDGSRIPMSQVYSDVGIVRNSNCQWRNYVPGWFCPRGEGADELRYYDVMVESLDADHERRRLSPLAVRSEGIIDIINGPGDHSCCIGQG